MSQVLSLYNYKAEESKEEFPGFVVFESSRCLEMYRFSPHLMQLGESLYAADLQATESYWKMQAKNLGCEIQELLKQVASGRDSSKNMFVFCDHPFRGYLFYQSLKQRESSAGCYFMSSVFARRTYGNISWHVWVMTVRKLENWMESAKQLVSERKKFSTQLARFERFISRMGLESIADLKQAEFHEVQRRFQRFLGLTWKWTFEKVNEASESSQQSLFKFQKNDHLMGFPWHPFHLFESPQRENLLEFPLSTWDQIEGELRKDLHKLSEYKGVNPPFQVMGYLWNVVLYDGDECQAPVDFNYPLCLQQDKEQDFAVSLKQLSYCFATLKNQLEEKAKETDFLNMPFILGWTLKVSRIVYHQKTSHSLFPEVHSTQNHQQDLVDLQNKLKSPIRSYKVHFSHVPAWDFSEKKLNEPEDDNENFVCEGVFSQKPLFLYHHPLEFSDSEIQSRRFLERTSSDWWSSQEADDHHRDYYICHLKSGDIVWAYKDFKGRWFKHGLYS